MTVTQHSEDDATVGRLHAVDSHVVLYHGDPAYHDQYGARDVWVFEHNGRYYMHYDAAGEAGWLAALAISDDGETWHKEGPVINLGAPGTQDSASASYGTTYFDGSRWHMFYLGTPNVTADELKTPSFPYMTMKAEADSPGGPWRKRPDITPFKATNATWYSDTASPGAVIHYQNEYLMYFSGANTTDNGEILRTLGLARTNDLSGTWAVDPEPLLPVEGQIENSSLYFEPTNGYWFLFTNHIGKSPRFNSVPPQNTNEYTDAIWVYWSQDPTSFRESDKAVVLDSTNINWSPRVVGLPCVLPIKDRLAVYFDGCAIDTIDHGGRDIGLAWMPLPLTPPMTRFPVTSTCWA